jgi:hypothetical protein
MSAADSQADKKVYLLVGITSHGKSTVGNCILNKSGDEDKIQKPFQTSDLGVPCTNNFKLSFNENVAVIDSIGFGDPKFTLRAKSQQLIEEFRNLIKFCHNRLNGVLYVVRRGHFEKEVVDFFHIIQDRVLDNHMVNNSVLVVTNCESGWVQRELQKDNKELREAIDLCKGNYAEFKLAFENEGDEESFVNFKQHQRTNAVRALNSYLEQLNLSSVDMSFIQDHAFEVNFENNIMPKFVDLFASIVHQIHDKAARHARDSLTPVSDFYTEYFKRRNSRVSESEPACTLL